MACRNCYKYPFCKDTRNADSTCSNEKSKRDKLEEEEHVKQLRLMIKGMLED